jgi:hypothetical protein
VTQPRLTNMSMKIHNLRSSPLARLPPELRNKIYVQVALNDRDSYCSNTHERLVDFPRPLASTCRLFCYETAKLPYISRSHQQLCLEIEREEWIPSLEVVHILTRKAPIAWEPQLRLRWRQMLERIRGIARIHFCTLLAPDMVDAWLRSSDKLAWEKWVQIEVAFILPHAKVAFEWELAKSVKPTKAWADIEKSESIS